MKNVIFISYYFPPIHSVESTMALNAIKYLPEFGWRPIVIAAKRSLKDNLDKETLCSLPVGIEIYRTPSRENWFLRGLNRLKLIPDDIVGWSPFALKAIRQVLQQQSIHAVISRSYPVSSHLIALKVKNQANLPWVAILNDPWTQNPYVSYPSIWIKYLHEQWEGQVLRSADRVVVTNSSFKKLLVKKYSIDAKTIVLPNTYDESDKFYQQIQSYKSSPDHKFTITHTGNFYGLRSPEPFFRGLQLALQRHSDLAVDLHVKLVGGIGSFVSLITQYNLEQIVEVIPLLPRRQMQVCVLDTDLWLLVDAPSQNESIFLPAKLIEYLSTRKPILGITSSGASAETIQRTATGQTVAPDNIEKIAEIIINYYKLYKQKLPAEQPDLEEISKYSAKNYARVMAASLDNLVVEKH